MGKHDMLAKKYWHLKLIVGLITAQWRH